MVALSNRHLFRNCFWDPFLRMVQTGLFKVPQESLHRSYAEPYMFAKLVEGELHLMNLSYRCLFWNSRWVPSVRTAQTGLTKVVSQGARWGVRTGHQWLCQGWEAGMSKIVAMVGLMGIFLEFMNRMEKRLLSAFVSTLHRVLGEGGLGVPHSLFFLTSVFFFLCCDLNCFPPPVSISLWSRHCDSTLCES